ncbi:MAG: cell division protein ZapA [Eubacteriales bacterium]|nr:cell division protein ZapA [Eubacteriales bacterium]
MNNQTKVLIGGQYYTLSSNESEEYMQTVAQYLDHKMVELREQTDIKQFNSRMQTILLAINIVDDLFKERVNSESAKKRMEELKQENEDLKKEIEKTKAELEDYIKLLNAE